VGDAQTPSELIFPFGAFIVPFLCFSSELPIALRFLRRGRLRKVFKRSRSGRGATFRGLRMCGGGGRVFSGFLRKCAVRERAVSLRSRGAIFRGLRMCSGGGRVGGGFLRKCVVRERAVSLRSRGVTFRGLRMFGGVGEFGSGFSWKLMARVETQAHLSLRCDSDWGMHKRSASLKTLCPLGAFVVSFSSCFYSGLLLARRFLRHGRLRNVFNVLGVDEGLLSMPGSSVLRERAFDLRARTASAQG
jgi:hypothetical protein